MHKRNQKSLGRALPSLELTGTPILLTYSSINTLHSKPLGDVPSCIFLRFSVQKSVSLILLSLFLQQDFCSPSTLHGQLFHCPHNFALINWGSFHCLGFRSSTEHSPAQPVFSPPHFASCSYPTWPQSCLPLPTQRYLLAFN